MNISAASSVDPNDPLLFLLQHSHKIHLQHLSYLKGTRFSSSFRASWIHIHLQLKKHFSGSSYEIRIDNMYTSCLYDFWTFKIQFSINGSVVVYL